MPHRELRKNNFLHIEDVYKSYGKNLVLNDIDLSVEAGELCTVVGPSGCGKSTLLRLILGQEQPDSGEILIDGISSWWTACHGYNNPKIEESIIKQIKKMPLPF